MQRLMQKLPTLKSCVRPSLKKGFSTHYTTFSYSSNHAVITQPNKFSNGVFSNSSFAKHFLTDILSKCKNKGVSATLYGEVKAFCQGIRLGCLNPNCSYSKSGWQWGSYRLTSEGLVYALILSNVAVYTLWQFADSSFMSKNFMISVDNLKNGRIHTLITHAFSHKDVSHLFSNMLGLYCFGRSFGPRYLLNFYLAGAGVGAIFHLIYDALKPPSIEGFGSPALGANGAVNAFVLLFIALFPCSTIYVDFFIPLPAFVVGTFIISKDLLRINQKDSPVSGTISLGGAVAAACFWAITRRPGGIGNVASR